MTSLYSGLHLQPCPHFTPHPPGRPSSGGCADCVRPKHANFLCSCLSSASERGPEDPLETAQCGKLLRTIPFVMTYRHFLTKGMWSATIMEAPVALLSRVDIVHNDLINHAPHIHQWSYKNVCACICGRKREPRVVFVQVHYELHTVRKSHSGAFLRMCPQC